MGLGCLLSLFIQRHYFILTHVQPRERLNKVHREKSLLQVTLMLWESMLPSTFLHLMLNHRTSQSPVILYKATALVLSVTLFTPDPRFLFQFVNLFTAPFPKYLPTFRIFYFINS